MMIVDSHHGPERFRLVCRRVRAASLDWSDPVKTTKTLNADNSIWSTEAVAEYEANLPLAIGA